VCAYEHVCRCVCMCAHVCVECGTSVCACVRMNMCVCMRARSLQAVACTALHMWQRALPFLTVPCALYACPPPPPARPPVEVAFCSSYRPPGPAPPARIQTLPPDDYREGTQKQYTSVTVFATRQVSSLSGSCALELFHLSGRHA